jgi:hypothetical protein
MPPVSTKTEHIKGRGGDGKPKGEVDHFAGKLALYSHDGTRGHVMTPAISSNSM